MEATFLKELFLEGRDGYVVLLCDLKTLEARPQCELPGVSFQDDGAKDASQSSEWLRMEHRPGKPAQSSPA